MQAESLVTKELAGKMNTLGPEGDSVALNLVTLERLESLRGRPEEGGSALEEAYADWLKNQGLAPAAEGLVDDPIDDLKHEIHGMKFGDQRLFLPGWLMPGSGKP